MDWSMFSDHLSQASQYIEYRQAHHLWRAGTINDPRMNFSTPMTVPTLPHAPSSDLSMAGSAYPALYAFSLFVRLSASVLDY